MRGQEVAKRIEGLMIYCGLHQRDMARSCGISERTWRRWMADPDGISLGYLAVIAKRLGVKPSDLLRERGDAYGQA